MFYIDDGICAHVFALRSQHLDCKSDREKQQEESLEEVLENHEMIILISIIS